MSPFKNTNEGRYFHGSKLVNHCAVIIGPEMVYESWNLLEVFEFQHLKEQTHYSVTMCMFMSRQLDNDTEFKITFDAM